MIIKSSVEMKALIQRDLILQRLKAGDYQTKTELANSLGIALMTLTRHINKLIELKLIDMSRIKTRQADLKYQSECLIKEIELSARSGMSKRRIERTFNITRTTLDRHLKTIRKRIKNERH
jgi:DNA invertase Pin-like site-specific DNA recombinase